MSEVLTIVLFALSGFAIGFAIVKFVAHFRAKRRNKLEEEK